MNQLAEKVREILATELRIAEQEILPNARLRADLGMDSVAALNILFATEEAFGIAGIDVAEIATVVTVDDVEALVRRHVAQTSS
jgi:acyl carrier protein